MKVARTIFAVLLAAALSGCADYQAQQQAAQIKERNKAATRDCRNRFSTVTPENIVAAAQCRNAAMAITLPLLGSNQDLAQSFMAQRLAIAEQVQKGKLTVAEGSTAIWQKYSEAEGELQRRIAITQTAAAQQQTAAAQQNTADAQLRASTDTSAITDASQATGTLPNGGAKGKADAATQTSEEKNGIILSGPGAWPSPFPLPTGDSN
jgi:archaellum component FlaG (FlaF/FlaG flagellin family)